MSEEIKKPKILMVEDDAFTRKIYRNELVEAGFDYVEAINGAEGINKVLSDSPDLVLLDVFLPIKNGFEVLKEIKEKKEIKDIPVIILSNLGGRANKKIGLDGGAEAYFVKSEASFAEVISKIKEILK